MSKRRIPRSEPPTPSALRAAKAIEQSSRTYTFEKAQIIDQETGLPQLLAACRAILANADSPALRHVYADGKGTFAGVSVAPEQYAALKAAVENTGS